MKQEPGTKDQEPNKKKETIMNTRAFTRSLGTLATAAFIFAAGMAQAAITVTPDHIQGDPAYAVDDTLLAIDAPSSLYDPADDPTGARIPDGPAGPDWSEDADDGFSLTDVAGIMVNDDNRPGWEPDGTSATAAPISWMWDKPGESVTYAFDLPDGSIIHNVWGTWHTQGNSGDGHTYTYDEGSLTTFTCDQASDGASAGDLVLQWTDDESTTHDETFERIFAGDITVSDSDGFIVTFTQNPESGSVYPYIDAVAIDYTAAVPEPSTAILVGLGLMGVFFRRRRK